MRKVKIYYFIIIGLGLIFIDQIIKYYIFNNLVKGGFFIWNRLLGIDLFINRGIAFGLNMPKAIFYLAVALILYFLLAKFKEELKKKDFLVLLGLTFVIAGALSNLIDRFLYKGVIDYIHVFDLSVFNFADVFILVGVGLLIYKEFNSKLKIQNSKTQRKT